LNGLPVPDIRRDAELIFEAGHRIAFKAIAVLRSVTSSNVSLRRNPL
jgi:hypothetical protein